MKDYLATHVFKSEDMKKKFHEVVGSTSPEDLKKGVSGEKAVCHMTMMGAGDSMKMFCKWQAESPQAIIDQLGDMNNFFETTSEECSQIMDFSKMSAEDKDDDKPVLDARDHHLIKPNLKKMTGGK